MTTFVQCIRAESGECKVSECCHYGEHEALTYDSLEGVHVCTSPEDCLYFPNGKAYCKLKTEN